MKNIKYGRELNKIFSWLEGIRLLLDIVEELCRNIDADRLNKINRDEADEVIKKLKKEYCGR